MVRGVSQGDVDLGVEISGYTGPKPVFRTTVMPLYDVPIEAWIVADDNGAVPVTTEQQVRLLVEAGNLLLRQVCISCYVDHVFYTNRSDWIDLGTPGTESFNNRFDEMVSVRNEVSGLEVHFVQTAGFAAGLNNTHGMVLTAKADAGTFAHETGHAFGLDDIYAWHRGSVDMTSGSVRQEWSEHDWCGDENRGFYPDVDSLSQSNQVLRLVMHGITTEGRKDFSWGDVYGIRRNPSDAGTYELGHAPVGVFPGFTPHWPYHD